MITAETTQRRLALVSRYVATSSGHSSGNRRLVTDDNAGVVNHTVCFLRQVGQVLDLALDDGDGVAETVVSHNLPGLLRDVRRV